MKQKMFSDKEELEKLVGSQPTKHEMLKKFLM